MIIIRRMIENQKNDFMRIEKDHCQDCHENYLSLLEDFLYLKSHLISEEDSNTCQIIAIIPLYNNKFICFSCENLKKIDHNRVITFDILKDKFINDLFYLENQFNVKINPSIQQNFKNICEKEFEKFIYKVFPLPNQGKMIIGFLTHTQQSDIPFVDSLKLFQLKPKIYNFFSQSEIFTQNFRKIEDIYIWYFDKRAVYEKIEIHLIAKNNFEGCKNHFFNYNQRVLVNHFEKTHPICFMRKIDDLELSSQILENLLLTDLNSINYHKEYVCDEKMIKKLLNFEIKEEDQLDKILFFCVNINENLQIILALKNISKYYGSIENDDLVLNDITKYYYTHHLENMKQKLQRIIKILNACTLKRFLIKLNQYYHSKTRYYSFLNILLKVMKKRYWNKIKQCKKWKEFLRSAIFKLNEKLNFNQTNEKKLVISKFFRNSLRFQKKTVGMFAIKNFFCHQFKTKLSNCFNNLLQCSKEQKKLNKIQSKINELILIKSLEDKISLIFKNPCKIAFIFNESNSMIFSNNIKLLFEKTSCKPRIYDDLISIKGEGYLIKKTAKNKYIFYYLKRFQQFTFYSELILDEINNKSIFLNKMQAFLSENEIPLENLFLKLKQKITFFSLWLK